MRQLTGLDSAFLTMESSTTVGHVTGVLVLDTETSPVPWTFERFRRHLLSRIPQLTPFTQQLVEVPLGLDRPYWIDAPNFDLDYHLRHVAVPGDESRVAFSELVARIHARPLDRGRPLWECYVVDGLPDGKTGLITKVHHAAIDGISGQELLACLVDLEPDAPVPDEVDEWVSPAITTPDDVMARAILSLATSPYRMVKAGITIGRSLPILGQLLDSVDTAGGSESSDSFVDSVANRVSAPPTPFNKTIGPHRRWAYVSVPLDDVKAVKNELGLTVNDVVLGIVSGVLRRWLEENGGIPERSLSAMVPLSVRKEGSDAFGNHISGTVATLASNLDDPLERLQAIHEGMQVAKQSQDALPAEILTDITQVAPPAVAALASRLIASTKLADRVNLPFNVVVSNVPGPPIPIYLAGAEIKGHFPVSAIVDGVGLNVTVVSTNGMLDFGFVSDRDLVPDLWDMAEFVPTELKSLTKAAGIKKKKSKKKR